MFIRLLTGRFGFASIEVRNLAEKDSLRCGGRPTSDHRLIAELVLKAPVARPRLVSRSLRYGPSSYMGKPSRSGVWSA